MPSDMWSHFQPSRGLSRINSHSSLILAAETSSVDLHSYANLWEIQLELGEIPGMISNNLLEPCYPSRASATYGSVTEYRTDDESSDDEQEEGFMMFPGVMDGLRKPGTRYDTEYRDEEELDYEVEYDDEEKEEPVVRIHPIYGRIGSPQEGEFRHDRQDSGVFVCDQDLFTDGSIGTPKQEACLSEVDDIQRHPSQERCDHSAAYTSLKRIASTFLRSS